MPVYVAFVNSEGDCRGWTTKNQWESNSAIKDDEEIDHIIEFEGPEYTPELWTEEKVDEVFASLCILARKVVEEHKQTKE